MILPFYSINVLWCHSSCASVSLLPPPLTVRHHSPGIHCAENFLGVSWNTSSSVNGSPSFLPSSPLSQSHHNCIASHVTGHHRGPKRKLRPGYKTSPGQDMLLLCAVSRMFAYWTFPVSVHLIVLPSNVPSRAFSALCERYARIRRSGIILIP